jgi:tetratricopeptide (TPR) repeat protein
MAKFTEAEVDELVAAIRREDGNFAILTGAGCSIKANIPSGRTIAAEICEAYPSETESLSAEEKQDYGLCMARIPFAKRKQILENHLTSNKIKINWANIALASLIDNNLMGRILTFNFDSILTRACGLLGKYPATYDFGVAPWSKTKHLVEPCIIHLHGQGSGSAMMNTAEETRIHAQALQPLLKDTFERFPLIVIGYSGASDQVFPKIKELYDGEQSIYWLGHSDEPDTHIRDFFEGKHAHYCKYIGGIDADTFLIDLAQKLNCFPPPVLSDPARHLLTELIDVAEFPLKDITNDILKDTRERLDKYRDALKFTHLQTAVLQNKPTDIDANDKNINSEIAAWALIGRGNQHVDLADKTTSTSEKISHVKKAAQLFEAAYITNKNSHEALNNWGNALKELAKLQGDAELFKASLVKYDAALKIKPDFHEALFNWGNALQELAKLQGDVELFKACFVKYDAALKIKPDFHEALFNWGTVLQELAKLQGDVELFKACFVKYDAALKIKPDMYEALNNWGNALLTAWNLTKDAQYLEQATEVINRAEALKPDKCYNGACLASIKNDENDCKERLFRAKAAKTLPSRQHLEEDEDLANMRDKPWFQEFLKDL